MKIPDISDDLKKAIVKDLIIPVTTIIIAFCAKNSLKKLGEEILKKWI